MSEFKIAKILNDMVPGPDATTVIQTTYKGEDGILGAYGTSAVSVLNAEAADTYAPGCIYVRVNGASSIAYINKGAAGAVSSFQELTSADGTIATTIANIEAAYLAGTAGAVGPTPLLWDDSPLFQVMLDPEKGYYLFEDFNNSLDEEDVAATLTQNTGSATFTDDPTLAGGVMALDSAAATANHAGTLSFLAMQCKPGVGTHIYFEARVKIGVDTGGFIIGLMDDSSTDPLTATIVVNTDHAVFFRDEGVGSAAVGSQACDGSNVDSEDDTIADSDISEFETWGIHIFGDGNTAGDYVKFYHEGALVNTVTDVAGAGGTGVPDAVICPTFVVDNMGDSVQSKLTIDWMRVLCFNDTAGTARA